jgi:cysteine desulfurase
MNEKKNNIYLDNAATTAVSKEVVDAMLPFFMETYGNASSIHSMGAEAKKALEDARKIIAQKINASPDEIIFTSGGTESDNIALRGIAYANKDKGNHIITSNIEHPAVLNTCKELEKEGFKVTYLGVDKYGLIDTKKLKKSITKKAILVSIMHANNEIGTIQDIAAIGRLCKEKDVYFHTDAVQSFTKVPIDTKSINVDLISLSAHKIHGPKGVGALYVKKGTKIQAIITGGAHERRIRPGTENVSGIVGFAKAVEISDEEDNKKMSVLRDKLTRELLKIPETHLNGHPEKRLCNNASISFHFIEGESLLMHLDSHGIEVSTGSACSSHELKASHVLLAIGVPHVKAHGTIRFTLSKYTTEKDIDYAIKIVDQVVNELRKISPLGR